MYFQVAACPTSIVGVSGAQEPTSAPGLTTSPELDDRTTGVSDDDERTGGTKRELEERFTTIPSSEEDEESDTDENVGNSRSELEDEPNFATVACLDEDDAGASP